MESGPCQPQRMCQVALLNPPRVDGSLSMQWA
ncbi:hypothetical protein HYP93_gp09 [Stenotrophomonas phage Pokken]|uniref:Uncharacterized protein n=1 Tax=Stenotrophomonas phage Pokken TaxID=2596674 RepID=A0A5B9N9S2_9CAUD|nr:hypothetical protein HYP93_gp09 [Stenotrophomonas phage Pokken]QEG09232.1 hypothetical protein CPT_Pokken_009 [Stenotrophomonas phage Pokken]